MKAPALAFTLCLSLLLCGCGMLPRLGAETSIGKDNAVSGETAEAEATAAVDAAKNEPDIAPPAVEAAEPAPTAVTNKANDTEYGAVFDLSPYYNEPEPVEDAYCYNFTVKYDHSYYDVNKIRLPRLTCGGGGAEALNNKIKDDFTAKFSSVIKDLTDTGPLHNKMINSQYNYTVDGDFIVILVIVIVGSPGSDAVTFYYTVYFYDRAADRELNFDQYLAAIGESRESILEMLNGDSVRLANGGYNYGKDFYFADDNLLSAYRRGDGSFRAVVIIRHAGLGDDTFMINSPYDLQNDYYLYTNEYESGYKHSMLLARAEDDPDFGYKYAFTLPTTRDYELMWLDATHAAVAYYPEKNLRAAAVIDFENDKMYKIEADINTLLAECGVEPMYLSEKPSADIYPVSFDGDAVLTLDYTLKTVPGCSGKLYFNCKTGKRVYPEGTAETVYSSDASAYYNIKNGIIGVNFPESGVTAELKLDVGDITFSSYTYTAGREIIRLGYSLTFECVPGYAVSSSVPAEMCGKFFTSRYQYPGEKAAMVGGVFVTDLITVDGGGHRRDSYVGDYDGAIAVYDGDSDVFIALTRNINYPAMTFDEFTEAAKTFSWNILTD